MISHSDQLDQLENMTKSFQAESDLMNKGERLNNCQNQLNSIEQNFVESSTPFSIKKRLFQLKHLLLKSEQDFIKQFEFEKIKLNILRLHQLMNQIRSKTKQQNLNDSKAIIQELSGFVIKYKDTILLDHAQNKYIFEARHILIQFDHEMEFSNDLMKSSLSESKKLPSGSGETYQEVRITKTRTISCQNILSDGTVQRSTQSFSFNKKQSVWKKFRRSLYSMFSICGIQEESKRQKTQMFESLAKSDIHQQQL